MARPTRSSAVNKSGSATTANDTKNSTASLLPFGDLSKLTLKPPSLPIENDPKHLALLHRSLSQNDKEIVALDKLHESIRTVKSLILEHFGEEGLLDMVSSGPVPENKREYFLLLKEEFMTRMKLRRKLLNRLVRRLLRISHAMDGNIIGGSTLPSVTNLSIKAGGMGIFPPALPKYGLDRNIPPEVWDVTLSNSNSADAKKVLEDFAQKMKEKKEALQRIQQRRGGKVVADATPSNTATATAVPTTTSEDVGQPQRTEEVGGHPKKKKARKDTEENKRNISSTENGSAATSIHDAIVAFNPLLLDPDHQADLNAIKEYDDEYAKIITANDGSSSQYALTAGDFEEVHKTEDSFPTGIGIGSVVRTMSTRDKLTEWKRWSAELLSRIPIQPTFEDLGMENIIFGGLDERKRLAHGIVDEVEDSSNPKSKTRSKRKKGTELDVTDRKETRNLKKKPHDENGDVKEEEEMEEDEPQTMQVLAQKQKWFSFQPIPSFRDQDHNAFLAIQHELLNVSVQQQSRSRLEEYTNHHSRVYRRSLDLNTQKSKLETDLRNMTYAKGLELNKVRTDYAADIAALREQFIKESESFEAKKKGVIQAKLQSETGKTMDPVEKKALAMTDRDIVGRSLQGAVDRVTIRMGQNDASQNTALLQNAIGSVNPSTSAAGSTLSQMVDVVTQRIESSWVPNGTLDKVQADLNPPPVLRIHPAEESILKRYEKIESDLREQLAEVSRQLVASEAERAQAWAKLVKARGEMDVSNTASARKSIAGEPTKIMHAPPPPPTNPHAFTLGNRLPASFVASSAPTVSVPSNPVARAVPVPVATAEISRTNVSTNSSSSVAAAVVPSNVPNRTTKDAGARTDALVEENNEEDGYEAGVENQASPGYNLEGKSTFQRLYSVEAVKARMSVDGSIAPVTVPKKTKDGLFVRPAGRQRKNMDWDAVNGKWIPLQDGFGSVYPRK